MAKDKSLKSKPHKRKDLGPSDDSTEIMDTEVNTKRKKMDADVSSTENGILQHYLKSVTVSLTLCF